MYTVSKTKMGEYAAWKLADTAAGTAAVIVPEKGGMAVSFTRGAEEYLWLREPNFWQPERPRCAVPPCFPVCGPTPEQGNEFLGRLYPMDVHGFAHSLPWEKTAESCTDGACVTVTLRESEATLEKYPFAFCVSMTYTLKGDTLRFSMHIANTGTEPMPFSFGYHPYFAVSAIENLVWDIRADSVRDAATGALTPFTGVDFPYDPDQTTRHYAGVHSPMTFTDKGTGHRVSVAFDGHFTNAVLWQQGAERFVCMEPWNGFPGSLRTPQHETLAPGAALDAEFSVTIG